MMISGSRIGQLALTVGAVLCAAGAAHAQFTFAPGTSPEYVQAVHDAWLRANPGERYIGGAAWNLDLRRTVAFSFIRDGVVVPSQAGIPGDVDGPNILFSRMDQLFDDGDPNTNDRAAWQSMIAEAFDRWGSVSGVSFEFRRRLTPAGPDDDPAFDNWDDRNTWGDPGPLDGDTTVERGDIRIAMRPIDGPGGVVVAFSSGPGGTGDIILDSAENWANTANNFRFFDNAMARVVGNAIGLLAVCPEDGTKLMEPTLNLGFLGLRHDDIRGVQKFYGDRLEPNNELTTIGSSLIPYIPNGNNNNQLNNLSIDNPTDIDVFRVNFSGPIGARMFVTAQPSGFVYNSGPLTGGGICTSSPIDSSRIFNLRLGLYDAAGNSLLVPSTVFPGGLINEGALGEVESFTQQLTAAGTYFIVVAGDGASLTESQLYNLSVNFDRSLSQGMGLAAAIGDVFGSPSPAPIVFPFVTVNPFGGPFAGPTGHAAAPIYTDFSTLPPSDPYYDPFSPYTGTRAYYANVENVHVNRDHVVFTGRTIPFIDWDGTNPAERDIDDHPTGVAGAAAGVAYGSGDSQFQGAAPTVPIISASVSYYNFPGDRGFVLGREAAQYALFSLADPNFGALAGVPRQVTVMNNSWSGGSLIGEGTSTLWFDAISEMYNVTVVCSASNDGGTDNVGSCDESGGTTRTGTPFRGARTVGSPANGFNTISVGAVGRALPLPEREDPDNPDPDDGGGGGGGGPQDPLIRIVERHFGDQLSPEQIRALVQQHRTSIGGDIVNDGVPTQPGFGTGPGGGGGPPPERQLPLAGIPAFSAKGPIDAINWSNFTFQPDARPGVEILAVGTGQVDWGLRRDDEAFPDNECLAGGNFSVTSLGVPWMPPIPFNPNTPPNTPRPVDNAYFSGTDGTSFSAPVVSGGVALLQDIGLANGYSIDPLVMKAVLLTGAIKLPGWSNNGFPGKPQDQRDGRDLEEDPPTFEVATTAQPLDYAQGAGVMNLQRSFEIYHKGIPLNTIVAQFGGVTIYQPQTQATRDVAATDPAVPTIRIPDEPAAPPFPGVPMTLPGAGVDDAPLQQSLSPLAIARRLRLAESFEPPIFNRTAPITNPDLGGGVTGPVGEDPGPRVPVRPPSFGGGGGGGEPVRPPAEITTQRVTSMGWDHGNVGARVIRQAGGATITSGWLDYWLDTALADGDTFTATLAWNRTVRLNSPDFTNLDEPRLAEITHLELENLDLLLMPSDEFGDVLDGATPAAASVSTFNNVEHIYLSGPRIGGGPRVIRVIWRNTEYDLFNNLADGNVEFGLAWRLDWINSAPSSANRAIPTPMERLGIMLAAFGSIEGQTAFDTRGDLNHDGRIDAMDLSIILGRLRR